MRFEKLHRCPDRMVDQDHLGFVEVFQPQRQKGELDQECGEQECVVAIDGPIGAPDQVGSDQKRQHQRGEQAGPGLLQAEQDEFGERRGEPVEGRVHPVAERREERAERMPFLACGGCGRRFGQAGVPCFSGWTPLSATR
jgi:hypothetical protein